MYNQVGVERIRYNSTISEQNGSIYIDAKGDFEGDIRTRSGKNQIIMTFVIIELSSNNFRTDYRIEIAMIINNKTVVNVTKKYYQRASSSLQAFGKELCYDIFTGFYPNSELLAQQHKDNFNEALV